MPFLLPPCFAPVLKPQSPLVYTITKELPLQEAIKKESICYAMDCAVNFFLLLLSSSVSATFLLPPLPLNSYFSLSLANSKAWISYREAMMVTTLCAVGVSYARWFFNEAYLFKCRRLPDQGMVGVCVRLGTSTEGITIQFNHHQLPRYNEVNLR